MSGAKVLGVVPNADVSGDLKGLIGEYGSALRGYVVVMYYQNDEGEPCLKTYYQGVSVAETALACEEVRRCIWGD